jgi:hypothetical protein
VQHLHTAQRSPANFVLLLVTLNLYTVDKEEDFSSSIRRAVQDEACATSRLELRSQERRLRDAAHSSEVALSDSHNSADSSSSGSSGSSSSSSSAKSCAAVETVNDSVTSTQCSSSLTTLADDIHSLEQRMQSRLASLAAAAPPAAASGSSSAVPISATKHAAAASSSSWGLSSVISDDADAVRTVRRTQPKF